MVPRIQFSPDRAALNWSRLNRREHIYTPIKPACADPIVVNIFSRNVSAKVQLNSLSGTRRTLPPTFLFLPYAIFKEQTRMNTASKNPNRTKIAPAPQVKPEIRRNFQTRPSQWWAASTSVRSVCQLLISRSQPTLQALATRPNSSVFSDRYDKTENQFLILSRERNSPPPAAPPLSLLALYRPRKPKLSTRKSKVCEVFLMTVGKALAAQGKTAPASYA